ncbi:o-succinylbenzoate synthase [Chimaeribacter californicus]|uniref:o-succinylbenzoate synthase n=1 Tax=Chimaeribacter californicus TaxID=2060067 RepID=A0A2N5EED2_9GAMM|nr:o-succinylbenzoate synthase [Chimaeribacter californicus]PLR40857.1 o-succinylbenzoate synthase [Chimaeribacter californicus]
MRSATLYHYCLPLVPGTVLRDRHVAERDGLLVQLRHGAAEGWGEVAPLPGFSHETLPEAQAAVQAGLAVWQAGGEFTASGVPSVDWGLSIALAELTGALPVAADFTTVPLCHGDPDALFARLAGQKLAKMKVGLYEAVRDGMLVTLLLEALPDLHLRLDANRSWTPEKARQFARYVAPALRKRIAFLEEPCRTPQASRAFAQESGIPLAWDETVRDDGFQVEAEPGLAALVIKPMLMGSLAQVQARIREAQSAGLAVVISSSVESSLGLTQLARLAAWLTPGTAPGLDTLPLMAAQLVRPWPGSALPLRHAADLQVVWSC